MLTDGLHAEEAGHGAPGYSKSVITISLIIALFLVATASPLVQASPTQISQIAVHVERRGYIYRFEEFIDLSDLFPGSFYKANVYAVGTPDGLILIDCGAEDLYDLLMIEISKKFPKKPVVAVLLTHGHADHAGAGHYFLEEGVPVYAPIGDAYIIAMGNNFPGVPEQFTYTGYQPTGFLYGGDTIFGLRVLSTPGHTPGSISCYNEITRVLFTGDTTISCQEDDTGFGDLTFEMEYFTMLFSDNDSLNAQLGSLNGLLERALEKQIKAILPGHNRSYYGAEEAQRYILHSIDVVTQVLGTKTFPP